MSDRDQVEADWLLEHGRTREEVARMQAAARPGVVVVEQSLLLDARDALVRAEGEVLYGGFYGGDPRDFAPDTEACTEAELETHRLACEAADRNEPGARELSSQAVRDGALVQPVLFGHGATNFGRAARREVVDRLVALLVE